MIEIPVSYGEIVDKISILNVKRKNITSENKIIKVKKELEFLKKKYNVFKIPQVDNLLEKLIKINSELWYYEDEIRKSIKNSDNEKIIEFSVKICRTNDLRFSLKEEINKILNSDIEEVKEHVEY